MGIGSLLAALALGFVAGVIGRAVVPGDAFRSFSGWQSWVRPYRGGTRQTC